MRQFIAGLSVAVLLSACSVGGGPNTGPTARALDPVHDDVASLLVAFDLPRGLGTAPSGSLFLYDVANGGPAEHLRLTLIPMEGDPASAGLAPPEAGRAYYFYGFSEPDKASLRAVQANAQARNVAGSGISISLVPKLCTTPGVDPNLATVTVVAGLPGQTRLMPFISRQPLSELMQQPGSTQIPFCA